MNKDSLRSFQEECATLSPLETFDPAAFQGDEQVPQSLCSFVLALALIYNDCRDTIYAHILLQNSRPEGQYRVSRIWGSYYGMDRHILRLVVSCLHELFELIRKESGAIEHPFFLAVIKQLNSNARNAWHTLVEVALDKATPKNELGSVLLRIRNKVAFHYDPKAIFKGYSQHFLGPDRFHDRAYISRGQNMSETRLYFADTVVLGYLQSLFGKDKAYDLQLNVVGLIDPLNIALKSIVERFIQKRGFAYRTASE